MVVLCNLLTGVGWVLGAVLDIFFLLFIVHAILSWFSPDPSNRLVQTLNELTEPILSKVRSKVPSFGMIDVSTIIVILGIYMLQAVVVNSLLSYGKICLSSAVPNQVGI